jgi:hypothetical protein
LFIATAAAAAAADNNGGDTKYSAVICNDWSVYAREKACSRGKGNNRRANEITRSNVIRKRKQRRGAGLILTIAVNNYK